MPKKVFSLFNTHRWSDELGNRPACCDVVPVVGVMDFKQLAEFKFPELSPAALKYGVEFKNTEGFMCYFTKSNEIYKVPFKLGRKEAV
jgi:predicted component of type VI protein secretion system